MTAARPHCVATALVFMMFPAAGVRAQTSQPLIQMTVPVGIDSGIVASELDQRGVIFGTDVHVKTASWIRLQFSVAQLGGAPRGGQPAVLRITSAADGAVQTMNATHLEQWTNSSAYFNGNQVRVEIIADPNAPPSQVVISHAMAGVFESREVQGDGGIATICGSDDRVLSSDPRTGRLMPAGCTAWMFNDPNHTFLTAGHCSSTSPQVMEFNVPLSTSNGDLVHPGPEDQYAVDASSLQEASAGLGNDYGYFGCFPNTNTGLTPYERQQAFYILAPAAPAVNGQSIRITGYGVDSSPSSYNQVQQTSNGPYFSLSGTIIMYQCDTAGGNSGSAVLDESTQRAIGIHTHGGCGSSSESANSGCAIHAAGLQAALSNPQGVCIPFPTLCPGDVVRNQVVDIDDLLAVVGQFGGPGGVPADAAPLGGDGFIDVADILQVITAWGDCP